MALTQKRPAEHALFACDAIVASDACSLAGGDTKRAATTPIGAKSDAALNWTQYTCELCNSPVDPDEARRNYVLDVCGSYTGYHPDVQPVACYYHDACWKAETDVPCFNCNCHIKCGDRVCDTHRFGESDDIYWGHVDCCTECVDCGALRLMCDVEEVYDPCELLLAPRDGVDHYDAESDSDDDDNDNDRNSDSPVVVGDLWVCNECCDRCAYCDNPVNGFRDLICGMHAMCAARDRQEVERLRTQSIQ